MKSTSIRRWMTDPWARSGAREWASVLQAAGRGPRLPAQSERPRREPRLPVVRGSPSLRADGHRIRTVSPPGRATTVASPGQTDAGAAGAPATPGHEAHGGPARRGPNRGAAPDGVGGIGIRSTPAGTTLRASHRGDSRTRSCRTTTLVTCSATPCRGHRYGSRRSSPVQSGPARLERISFQSERSAGGNSRLQKPPVPR